MVKLAVSTLRQAHGVDVETAKMAPTGFGKES